MKIIFAIACMFFVGCDPGHEKERADVCEHSEGFANDSCNAGDDFSPLTCLTAIEQLENWWRDDAQTAINNCLLSSACYAKADGVPGPSIQVPLQLCLNVELVSLRPTDAQAQAVTKFCVKAKKCGELDNYTILQCEEVLLSPYDDGQLFLMMNDQIAENISNCDKSICDNFDNCVITTFYTAGAFNNINGVGVKMPAIMNH